VLRRVAAELGVEPEALAARLGELDPRLGAVRDPDGEIDRSTMTETYTSSLCAVHAGSRNRPVACP
jgi:hypothetical protein